MQRQARLLPRTFVFEEPGRKPLPPSAIDDDSVPSTQRHGHPARSEMAVGIEEEKRLQSHPKSSSGLISMMRFSLKDLRSMMRKAAPSRPSTFCRTIGSGNVSTLANGSQS